eukprot:TRINITY_DN442_c0_g1_i1.p1 TRINITY_DN442_c0_g1~~TRINITY_DN442_c0_g1_i1.p1  ORF type:complete len:912 (-),score=178.32 TRINITY_DN442_c0_g1_i1:11-2746(-)
MSVMISLHVLTMKDFAEQLKKWFEGNGISVWLCTSMSAGLSFRDEIVKNVENCDIFLPLINTEWAESGECEDEFNFARRLNLTRPKNNRKPQIIPIAFPGLDWGKYPHVKLLSTSTNFLIYKEEDPEAIYGLLKDSLESVGFRNLNSTPPTSHTIPRFDLHTEKECVHCGKLFMESKNRDGDCSYHPGRFESGGYSAWIYRCCNMEIREKNLKDEEYLDKVKPCARGLHRGAHHYDFPYINREFWISGLKRTFDKTWIDYNPRDYEFDDRKRVMIGTLLNGKLCVFASLGHPHNWAQVFTDVDFGRIDTATRKGTATEKTLQVYEEEAKSPSGGIAFIKITAKTGNPSLLQNISSMDQPPEDLDDGQEKLVVGLSFEVKLASSEESDKHVVFFKRKPFEHLKTFQLRKHVDRIPAMARQLEPPVMDGPRFGEVHQYEFNKEESFQLESSENFLTFKLLRPPYVDPGIRAWESDLIELDIVLMNTASRIIYERTESSSDHVNKILELVDQAKLTKEDAFKFLAPGQDRIISAVISKNLTPEEGAKLLTAVVTPSMHIKEENIHITSITCQYLNDKDQWEFCQIKLKETLPLTLPPNSIKRVPLTVYVSCPAKKDSLEDWRAAAFVARFKPLRLRLVSEDFEGRKASFKASFANPPIEFKKKTDQDVFFIYCDDFENFGRIWAKLSKPREENADHFLEYSTYQRNMTNYINSEFLENIMYKAVKDEVEEYEVTDWATKFVKVWALVDLACKQTYAFKFLITSKTGFYSASFSLAAYIKSGNETETIQIEQSPPPAQPLVQEEKPHVYEAPPPVIEAEPTPEPTPATNPFGPQDAQLCSQCQFGCMQGKNCFRCTRFPSKTSARVCRNCSITKKSDCAKCQKHVFPNQAKPAKVCQSCKGSGPDKCVFCNSVIH